MPSDIANFYNKMVSKGVRYAYQYRMYLPDTAFGGAVPASQQEFSFYAQAATLPQRTITVAPVNFQGMKFSMPNTMEYGGTMTFQVNCDPQMTIRSAVENWMNRFGYLAFGGGGEKTIPTNSNLRLDLLDEALEVGAPRKQYLLVGCFPTSIGEAALGQGSTEILTFQLGIQYQYYVEGTGSAAPQPQIPV